MRTLYLFVITAILTIWTLPAWSEDQTLADWQSDLTGAKNYYEDREYKKMIKGIYSPQLLQKVEIWKDNLEKWTTVYGSISFDGKSDGSKRKGLDVAMEASLERGRQKDLLNYTLKGKISGLEEFGIAARIWAPAGAGIITWDNELLKNSESKGEILSIIKFELNF